MQVFGTLKQSDDGSKGALKKGNEFPHDAQDGDFYTLISGHIENTYVKQRGEWVRVLLDGDYIDAGSY